MYPVNPDGFGMLGWISSIASVAGGLLFFAGILVVLYFLVRFLIIGTRAAELYVARHAPPRPPMVQVPEPRHEPTSAPTSEQLPEPIPAPTSAHLPASTPTPASAPADERPTVAEHPSPESPDSATAVRATAVRAPAVRAPSVRATPVRAPATDATAPIDATVPIDATAPIVKVTSKSRVPRGASTHAAPPEPPTITAP